MRELSGRVSRFTDSVIRRMTRISEEYDAINLSQGYPDFDPPREILEALEKAVWAGPHQYSITFGAKNLRDALAAKASPGLGRDIDPETEIIITCGGTEPKHNAAAMPAAWWRCSMLWALKADMSTQRRRTP